MATRTTTAETRTYRLRRLLFILLLLDLAYVINAMDRQVFPALIPRIADDLAFSPGQAGLQTTIFTLGMGLAAIPAGYVADRIGRKNMILLGLVAFSVATFLQGVAYGFFDMAVYRVVAGAGEGMQNAALYAAVGSYFYRNRATAVGTLNAAYGLGAFVGPILGNQITEAAGSWRAALFVFALIGGVVLLLVLFGVPKSVAEYGQRSEVPVAEEPSLSGGRLFNRNIILLILVTVVSGFAVYGWLGLYPTFLQDGRGFTAAEASLVSGLFGIGALTAVFVGALADRSDQRLFNIIGLAGIATVGGVMFAAPLGLGVHMVLSPVMGLCITGILYTNTNSLMQRFVPAHRVGTVVGVFVAGYYLPASVAGYVFATTQGHLGWAGAGLVQMVAFPAVGLLAMLFVRKPPPTRSVHRQDREEGSR